MSGFHKWSVREAGAGRTGGECTQPQTNSDSHIAEDITVLINTQTHTNRGDHSVDKHTDTITEDITVLRC